MYGRFFSIIGGALGLPPKSTPIVMMIKVIMVVVVGLYSINDDLFEPSHPCGHRRNMMFESLLSEGRYTGPSPDIAQVLEASATHSRRGTGDGASGQR